MPATCRQCRVRIVRRNRGALLHLVQARLKLLVVQTPQLVGQRADARHRGQALLRIVVVVANVSGNEWLRQ